MPEHTIQAVVVGAAGYSGRECCALLLNHPSATLVGVFGSEKRAAEAPQSLGDVHPRLRGLTNLTIGPADVGAILALAPDVVFLATPVEASLALAANLLDRPEAPVVIDISGAFRLKDARVFQKHYGPPHPRPDLLASAAYGLPEINRDSIAGAPLIACAGCYPTSAIIPLSPLVGAGAIDAARRPVIDSISGASGAGRAATAKTHFCEVSFGPYAVLAHRHQPEIDAYAGLPTIFTPHLAPIDRGIVSTIHADLAPGWTAARVRDLYAKSFADEPFVRLLPAGQWPTMAGVVGTNFIDLALAADDAARHLIIVSALDNLLKGAAGQAVQCMNIRLGIHETAGLAAAGAGATAPEGAWL